MVTSQITCDYINSECLKLYEYLIDNNIIISNKNILDEVEKKAFYYMMKEMVDIPYNEISDYALFDNDYLKLIKDVEWCDFGVDGCHISYEAQRISFFNFKFLEGLKDIQSVSYLKSSKDFFDKIKNRDDEGLEGQILEAYKRNINIIDVKRNKWTTTLYLEQETNMGKR